jgi:thioredoxin 1
MSSANVIEVGSDQFDSEVLGSPVPVIVDFWAPWCAPCRMMAPEFEKLAGDHSAKARFVKVNIEEARDVATRYGVMSIPTLAKFEGGEIVAQIVGARGADAMAREFGLA